MKRFRFFILLLFLLIPFNLFAFPPGVYGLPDTRQEVEPGIWIIQGTDGLWYQITGQDDAGAVGVEVLPTGNAIADSIIGLINVIGSSGGVDYDPTPPVRSDPLKNYFPEGFNPDVPDGYHLYIEQLNLSGQSVAGAFYEITKLTVNKAYGTFTYEGGRYISGWGSYNPFANYNGTKSFNFSNGLGSVRIFSNFYNDFVPGKGGYDNSGFAIYTGWGYPATGVTPDQDIDNPDSPVYVPPEQRDPVKPVLEDTNTILSILRNIQKLIIYDTYVISNALNRLSPSSLSFSPLIEFLKSFFKPLLDFIAKLFIIDTLFLDTWIKDRVFLIQENPNNVIFYGFNLLEYTFRLIEQKSENFIDVPAWTFNGYVLWHGGTINFDDYLQGSIGFFHDFYLSMMNFFMTIGTVKGIKRKVFDLGVGL